tara:strand:+ start:57317 stop:60931 length:3615 start_codon:yes stop_codon:yes gene_type:complete
MVYIKKVETRGFKSFGSRPVTVNFEGQFIGITGPNGSGKSNIIDAILFAIGENRPRMMRVPKLSGLIFDGAGQNPSTSARVTITLDNTDREISVDNDRVTLTREIRSGGDSVYLLNGKKIQKSTLSELLRLALINSDGLNFVPQGMVTSIADKDSDEKRILIEEVVGVAQFDEKKEDALKQLDIADRKLEVAMAKIGEVKKKIDSLEGERNDQLRLHYLENERNNIKSSIINQKLEDTKTSIETNNQLIIQLSNEKIKLDEELNSINQQIKDVETKKQTTLSQAIGGASDELLDVQINLSTKKDQLIKLKNQIEEYTTATKKINDSLPYLNEMLSENVKTANQSEVTINTLTETLTRDQNDLDKLNNNMKDCDSQRNKLRYSIIEEEKLLSNINQQLRTSFDKKNKLNKLLSDSNAKKLILTEKISNNQKKKIETETVINLISNSISKLESLKSNQEESLSYLHDSNSKLATRRAQIESELSKAVDILTKANQQVIKHESKVEAAKEITSKQNVQTKIKSIVDENSVTGYLGGTKDLFNYSDKYKTALEAASKRWSNAVFVEDMPSLFKVVTLIKKHKLGRVALIPLSDVADFEKAKTPKNKDVLGSLADFIKVDPKYLGIKNFIFGDTLLVSSAKAGYILSQKGYRTVSISGDLFEPGGSVFETGSISPLANLFFDSKSLSQIKSSVNNLRDSIQKRKSVITNLNSKVKEMESDQQTQNLGITKVTSELKNLQNMKDRYLKVIEKTTKTVNHLNNQLSTVSSIIITQENNLLEVDNLIKEQKTKVDSQSSLDSQKNKLNSLDDEKTRLSTSIDELSETIRNNESTVTKERGNLEHNLKNQKLQLTQEITTLEQELKDKNEFLNTSDQILADLKTNVESLTDQEKLLSDESRKMKPILDALDKEIKSHTKNKESIQKRIMENTSKSQNTENNTSRLSDSINTYKNNLNELGRNKIMEYFSGAENLLLELDKEYNYLRTRVNLLADEQYRDIYFGYKGFSERKNQLQKERIAIVEFIEGIDSEKRDAFLDAYQKIDKEFRSIFAQLTTRDDGVCKHENCPPGRLLHGDAWLELDNPDEIFSAGVTLMATFPNKVPRDIVICSGGEKTIAALCLILAIQGVKPAPFYVFDEIDAALDAVNSTKLAEILENRTSKSQVIMITLKDTILSRVDNMYGVYHERSITKIVKHRLKENKPKEMKISNIVKD